VPEITGFTNNVPAGLGKTITVGGEILDPFMTIQGNYFGSQQHTGTLFFKNANQVDAYPVDEDFNPISIDNYDIDSWNDDEIILKLPSIINAFANDGQRPVPGSGEFKVMNFAGYEHEASGLTIPYALYQYIDKDTINNSLLQKANVYLSNQNDSGGYTISFDQSVEDFSPLAKQAATRAIHDWKCATLVNWEIGEDNLSNSTGDGICTISASAMGGGSILQVTSPEIIKCYSTYPHTFFLKEFNIEINTDINWQIDTTVEDNLRINKFDFYSTIAHELGHGHMLEHVKEGSNIMYHKGDRGYIPAEARRTVWDSPDAIEGGNTALTGYGTRLHNCTQPHAVNYADPKFCIGYSGYFSEVKQNEFNITCYPNPVKDKPLILEFFTNKSVWVQYTLYDLMGSVIKKSDTQKKNGLIHYIIPMQRLKPGLYVLKVIINNKYYHTKIIKL